MNVFVSVGTHPQAFDRLLLELDPIAKNNKNLNIFAQTGNCKYKPKNFESKNLLASKEYDKKMREANLVISHGGAGTIINALLKGKPLLVVPRLQKFNEHTNDHQLDLAKALAAEGKALAVFEMKELAKKISQAKSFKPNLASNRPGLIKKIADFLEQT